MVGGVLLCSPWVLGGAATCGPDKQSWADEDGSADYLTRGARCTLVSLRKLVIRRAALRFQKQAHVDLSLEDRAGARGAKGR